MKTLALGLLFVSFVATAAPRLTAVTGKPPGAVSLAPQAAGRMTADGTYQWPGLYFEATFKGDSAWFETGPGDVILHVSVDGTSVGTLVKPRAGTWRVDGLEKGTHVVRVDAVTESQDEPNSFKGFALPAGFGGRATAPRQRQIEFIGDSHTVGYGNTSKTRDCTEDDVWKTTDSSAAFGPQVGRHYDADYQINAISGRGIVRNYGGFAADTLPQTHPFVLFDKTEAYNDPAWQPQLIIIAAAGSLNTATDSSLPV